MKMELNTTNSSHPEWMSRTVQLLGDEAVSRLGSAHVLVAGLGGVGSSVAENLSRVGIGELTLVDRDTVQPTNINRQFPALHSTIGRSKAEVVAGRLMDINPDLKVHLREVFLKDEVIDEVLSVKYDFVVDAIDTLSPKLNFIHTAYQLGIPFTSSMGSGGRTDPTKISITDFSKTFNCPLAFVLRKRLRKMGVHKGFKVVFSSELINKDLLVVTENEQNKKSQLGTVPYIPMIFGAMLSSIVVDGILATEGA